MINKKSLLIICIIVAAIFVVAVISDKAGIIGLATSGACSGNVHNCPSHDGDQSACQTAGCAYKTSNSKCTGSHDSCSTYSNQPVCESHSCSWAVSGGTAESNATTVIISGGEGIQRVVGIAPRIPLDGDSVFLGTMQLKVQIYYGGDASNDASVSANSTMFGEVKLIHEAGLPNGIYAANVTIGAEVQEGKNRITYTARQAGQFDEVSVLIEVKSGLDINSPLNDKYYKGNSIRFIGNVLNLNSETEANAKVIISGYKDKNRIFTINTTTDKEGRFLTDYFIKYADAEGEWDIIIEAISKSGVIGIIKIPIEVEVPIGAIYYSVNFLSPLKDASFRRGEIIPITLEIKDVNDLIENSDVVIYTPGDEEIALQEIKPGIYSGDYVIKPDDAIGNWFLRAEARKEIDNVRKVGGASIPINIGSNSITFTILSPETDVVYANSRLEFKARMAYSDGSLVKGAKLNAFLSNGEIVQLLEKSDGVYRGDYLITAEDLGTLNVEIKAEDINENVGSIKETLFVRKRSFIGNITAYLYEGIRKYLWAILIFLAIACYLLMPTLEINSIKKKLQKARKEERRVKEMQIEAERRYYKDGSITKKDFRRLVSKYEDRLAKAKEEQAELEKTLNRKIKDAARSRN